MSKKIQLALTDGEVITTDEANGFYIETGVLVLTKRHAGEHTNVRAFPRHTWGEVSVINADE